MAKAPEMNATDAKLAEPAAKADSTPRAVSVPQRKIPGNLPYLAATGTFEKVLDRVIEAARPPKFNSDFLENVLKLTGGAARATIPILKRMEFVASDGTPTELYARFRTESGRGAAALNGLRSAFPEIFKRSDYAHSVDDAKLKDILVEITGLKPADPIVRAIRGTFNVLKAYVPDGMSLQGTDDSDTSPNEEAASGSTANQQLHNTSVPGAKGASVGLVYNINLVIPETSDVRVLNAIFKAVRENLLQ